MRKVLIMMIAAAAISASSCDNAEPNSDFARYRLSVKAPGSQIAPKPAENIPENGLVNGVLEIAVSSESACLSLTGLRFTEATLTEGNKVVTTFLARESQAGNICSEATSESLREVIERPDEHQLTVTLANGTVIHSELDHLKQSIRCDDDGTCVPDA